MDIIPFLTPLLAVIGVLFFYLLLKEFFTEAEKQKAKIEKIRQIDESLAEDSSYVDATYKALKLEFADRPENGLGESYPRFCLKVPTAGGKTLANLVQMFCPHAVMRIDFRIA